MRSPFSISGIFSVVPSLLLAVVFAISHAATSPFIVRGEEDQPPPPPLRFVTMYKDGLEGFEHPTAVVVSGDGKHVYATAEGDDILLAFSRNQTSGELTLLQTLQNRWERPAIPNATPVQGLGQPKYIALSPDHQHVYVAGSGILIFARDAESGYLSLVEKLEDRQAGGLSQIEYLTFSPDGKNVYGVGMSNGTLGVFTRDQINGQLRPVQVFQNKETRDEKLPDAIEVDALELPRAVVVSPDGKHVYSVSFSDSAVIVFSRDAKSGKLTPVETIQQKLEGGRYLPRDYGLTFANGIATSPDGLNIYVASISDQLAIFRRDPESGKLTFLEVHRDGENGVDGLDYALSVTVSPGGRQVFVVGHGSRAIAVFEREPKQGRVKFQTAIKDEVGDVDGLAGIQSLPPQ